MSLVLKGMDYRRIVYMILRENWCFMMQILKQNVESCKRQKQQPLVNKKNHGDLYIPSRLNALCPMRNSRP